MTDSIDASTSDDPQKQIERLAEYFLVELQAGRQPDKAALAAAHPGISLPLQRRLALVERLF
ncbi:MAG: hypothetical protein ACKV0T_17810 [Planctomycetales bacterium]